jgi:glutamate/tyrosine decarboxylase-like PLP-dependent enzyme
MLGKGKVPYETEGMRGSRPGGPIAAAWAVTRLLGQEGYLERTAETLDLIDAVVAGIEAVDGLRLVVEPTAPLVLYTSDELDIFAVAHGLGERGWAMHQDDYPCPVIRSLWPWGMRAHLDHYLRDLASTVAEVRDGAIAVRAEASY